MTTANSRMVMCAHLLLKQKDNVALETMRTGTAGSRSVPWPRCILLGVLVSACLVTLVSSFTLNAPSVISSRPAAATASRTQISMGLLSARPTRRWPFFRKTKNLYPEKNTIISTMPILVKPRPMVRLNADTGEYFEVERVETVPAKPRKSFWNSFKKTVYGVADGVSSIPKRLNRDEKEMRPIDGYGDTIEQVVLTSSSSGDTPGQRLMKELESNPRKFVQEDDAPKQQANAWDSVKSGVYGAVDGVSGMFFAEETENPAKKPVAASFKPVAQQSLSTSPTVKQALPDLNSANPIQKLKAEFTIREWEEKQRKEKLQIEREQFASEFKESIFKAFDAVNVVVEVLASLPEKVMETADKAQQWATTSVQWMASLPKILEGFANDVQAVPSKIEKTVEETQASIDNSIEITKNVVDDVKAIPQTVSQKVEDAKTSVLETQKSMEETVYNVKVLLGTEKPKPRPPNTPPPKPITAKDIAWKVTGALAEGTGKVAFWVAKGAAGLGWKGAQALWSKGSEAFQESSAGKDFSDQIKAAQTQLADFQPMKAVNVKAKDAQPSKPSKEAVKQSEDLEREVTQAMQLAEEALLLAEDGTTGTAELDKAVSRAKEAAMKATKDALEIEENMKKSKR